MAKKKTSSEGRGLLQPEEFDIDDLDYLDPSKGSSRDDSRDWSRAARNRRGRWLRSKCLCWTLFLVVILLIAGAALNKGGKFKIPKFRNKPTAPGKPVPPSESDAPGIPDPPPAVEPPASVVPPGVPALPVESTSSASQELYSTTSSTSAASKATESVEYTNDVTSSKATDPEGESAAIKIATSHGSIHNDSKDGWAKPEGFKIIGLLFYGRPDTVGILDCYLRKNLVRNGGFLDEVQFVINTDKKDDIDWLDLLVDEVQEYKKVEPKFKGQVDGYNTAWATCNKKDMYIKIDDDIVFFDDQAVPNLVFSLMKHPEALNVVSTLINSPETGWLHYRLGAIHAYLPERSRSRESLGDFESYGPKAWRASALPFWKGEDMEFPVAGVNHGKDDGRTRLPEDDPGAPPYKGHRWLPLPGGDKDIWRTPSSQSKYDPDGPDWFSWSLGAQAHYSFLQNLENDTLDVYHFGSGLDSKREGIWNMAYERMNINFMAIWGKDVRANLPFPTFDDELALSVDIPLKLRRRKLILENTHSQFCIDIPYSADREYPCHCESFSF